MGIVSGIICVALYPQRLQVQPAFIFVQQVDVQGLDVAAQVVFWLTERCGHLVLVETLHKRCVCVWTERSHRCLVFTCVNALKFPEALQICTCVLGGRLGVCVPRTLEGGAHLVLRLNDCVDCIGLQLLHFVLLYRWRCLLAVMLELHALLLHLLFLCLLLLELHKVRWWLHWKPQVQYAKSIEVSVVLLLP